jgi:hypothetical protein
MRIDMILNIVCTLVWLAFGIWGYFDCAKYEAVADKKLKWAIHLLLNPFALKKYKKARMG